MKPNTCCLLITILMAVAMNAQQFSISDSLNTFAINFLAETSREAGDNLNIALSPYTVWALMALISEGAMDNTARQIETTLNLPANKAQLRRNFQNLSQILLEKSDGIELNLDTAVFTNKEFPVKKTFEDISKRYYDASVNAVDFRLPEEAVSVINKYVARATRNRIPVFVNKDDVKSALVFLTSVLYFKGRWSLSFLKNATRTEVFYDEKNNAKGEVQMMFRAAEFPYARVENLKSHVVELPYGRDKKMSMVIVLPFKGDTIANVLTLLSRVPFLSIMQSLQQAEKDYRGEDVHVYLPRFKVSSDFHLNEILYRLGINDLFLLNRANLLGMFDQYLYLSKFIQRAEIDVNEEGTVATAAAGASFPDRIAPPKVRVNRPFLYFIVEKSTNAILFAGKVTNPNTLQ